MPLQATSGAASYDAFGGGVPVVPAYIEEVFSTYLYTGNGTSQSINNGIDLAGKGGMVWTKSRSQATENLLWDTARGAQKYLISSSTGAQSTSTSDCVDSFASTGFVVKGTTIGGGTNANGTTYASWTFRKQPKFFDVITWTGTGGTGDRAIAHSLAAVPAAYTIKPLTFVDNWQFRHKDLPANTNVFLNLTNAATSSGNRYGSVPNTSSTFYVNAAGAYNLSGETYVAYLFADNAGGFGLTGTDNVISCGSYTGNGSATGPVINLGYEPQWVLIKSSSAGSTENWYIFDSMRGMVNGSGNDAYLIPNLTNAEAATILISPTATGFTLEDGNTPVNRSSTTYIYIAIRRGPMKVPTDATKVFIPNKTTSTTASTTVTTNFPVDLTITKDVASGTNNFVYDRLRGSLYTSSRELITNSTAAESSRAYGLGFDNNTGYRNNVYNNNETIAWWNFRRAPSFFDEVCFTGDGTLTPLAHNLGVSPELVIVKRRSSANGWYVSQYLSSPSYGQLNTTDAFTSQGSSYPVTSTTFVPVANTSGQTFVTYLFSTAAGVSKVGSYTGTGTTKQVDCGFTAGARFVMVKATSTTGNWIVADSARGIVAGNDPALYLNSTAAEVTGLDWIDADNSGFVVNETATIAANTNGVSYIFLAIA